jgi:hypothetical protein
VVFAGLFGLASVVEGVRTIGFFAFFIFMANLGVALLRRRTESETAEAPSVRRRSRTLTS